MKRMYSRKFPLIFTGLLLTACAAEAETARPLTGATVGAIEDINGDPSAISIYNHGRKVTGPFGVPDPIYLDDEIAVTKPGTTVTLGFSEMETADVEYGKPYHVHAASLIDIVRSYGQNFAELISSAEHARHVDHLASTSPSSHKGNDDNDVYPSALLGGDVQLVRAGRPQVIPVMWAGGRAKVRLLHGRDVLHESPSLSAERGYIFLDCPALQPGEDYVIVIGEEAAGVAIKVKAVSEPWPADTNSQISTAARELTSENSEVLQGLSDTYAVKGSYYLAEKLISTIGGNDSTIQ